MHLSPKTRSFFPLPSLGFLHTNRLAGMLQTSKWGKVSLQKFCNHFRTPVCGLYGVLFWEVRGKVSVKVWRRSAVKA